MGEDIARLKVRLEHCHDPRRLAMIEADIADLRRRQRQERALLVARVRQSQPWSRRLELLCSIPGIGLPTALAPLIGMPELGQLSREQAASDRSAPFDRDSGKQAPPYCRWPGPPRQASMPPLCPLPSSGTPALKDLYQRLIARGKAHKQALVACARKLIILVPIPSSQETRHGMHHSNGWPTLSPSKWRGRGTVLELWAPRPSTGSG